MPRIRSIHPSACTSEKLAVISGDAERCYWRLQTHCDDDGRAEDHPRLIWAALFPLHEDVTAKHVDVWLEELADVGLVNRYEVDGKRCLVIVGWAEKQSPRHPTASKLPPPSPSVTADRGSPTADRAQSPEDRADPPPGVEVGEGEGVGGGAGGVELALSSPPATACDPVIVVFAAWQEHTGHRKANLDKKRRTKITAALKDYPVEDLVDACRGVHLSPHHAGQNDTRTVYDELELVLRDSAHIERFRDLARGQGPSPPRLPQNAESVRRAVAAIGGSE